MNSGTELASLFNSESRESREEDELLNIIVGTIIDVLKIGNRDRDLYSRMLKYNLEQCLLGRHNALHRYSNNKLQKLLPEIYMNFDLNPEEIDIDVNHESHAKLYSIIKAIKKRYDISDPKRNGIPPNFGKRSEGMDARSPAN